MISVKEAKQKLLSKISPVDTVEINLQEAVGHVTAEPVFASISSPLFNNSSMDGFAVISDDVSSASEDNPQELTVVGDIPAGSVPGASVTPGSTMRIMTGAPIPDGADSVVPVEKTSANFRAGETHLPDKVLIYSPVSNGSYIRVRGEDFSEGQELILAGKRLHPKDIGLLALVGKAKLKVYRQPRIALFSTGDELLTIDSPLEPGKIRETNSFTLSALINDCGAQVINLGIIKDKRQDILDTFDRAKSLDVDMIISSAGVSVGAYDYIKTIIEEKGEIDIWRVNMRPGKPFTFGRYKEIPYIGLPGNPVSSFVGFEVFLRPAIHYLGGEVDWERNTIQAVLSQPVSSDGRESYLRAQLGSETGIIKATLTGHQGSGNVYSLVQANGLIIIPAGVKSLPEGAIVDAWYL